MKKIKVVWSILSVALMALIFFFSHQSAEVSSDTSGGFAQILAKVLGVFFKGEVYETLLWVAQWIVRKSAHLVLFALLGVFVYNSIDLPKGRKRFLIALIICIIYAVSDEIHQYFIPGRACRMTDVMIDAVGSILAILMRNAECGVRN